MKNILCFTMTALSLGLYHGVWAQEITFGKNTFRFGGYARVGIGASEGGATQAFFKAPGAQAKYRLGNEADNYFEYRLTYEYMLDREKGKSLELVHTGVASSDFGKTQEFTIDKVNQLYVKMDNLYNNIDVWMGRRYYHRKESHMVNYFWLAPNADAQAGVGVEGLRGKNKPDDIKIALFKYEDPKVKAFNPTIDQTKEGVLDSYKLDVRWVNIPVNKDGTLNFVCDYSIRAARKDLGFNSRNGFGLGLWHEQKKLFSENFGNTFAVLYKKGISMLHRDNDSSIPNKENDDSNQYIVAYDLNRSYSFEVSNNIFFEYEKQFALEGNLIYHIENQGVTPYDYRTRDEVAVGNNLQWFSAGFRYLHYLHKHFNLALEVGADYVDNKTLIDRPRATGWLTKITLSPQISWGYGYWTRPVIRAFVTYAFWDKSMKGLVGNRPGSAPYGNRTDGFTIGAQLEIWL